MPNLVLIAVVLLTALAAVNAQFWPPIDDNGHVSTSGSGVEHKTAEKEKWHNEAQEAHLKKKLDGERAKRRERMQRHAEFQHAHTMSEPNRRGEVLAQDSDLSLLLTSLIVLPPICMAGWLWYTKQGVFNPNAV
jgi:hypothetical protein